MAALSIKKATDRRISPRRLVQYEKESCARVVGVGGEAVVVDGATGETAMMHSVLWR